MADKDFIVKNGIVAGANNLTLGTASYFASNGNVGFGDANPSYKLSVTGTFNASGNITQGGTRAVLNDSGTWSISVTGNAGTSTKASTLAQSGGSGAAMTFNWSGQSGQPSWLWGSNDGTNIYVYNPSNFNVNSASYSTSSGSASSATNATNLTGGTLTASSGTINGNLTVAAGDLYCYRSGGASGVLFLNSAGNRYVYYDGTSYYMPGAELYVNGTQVVKNSGTWSISVTGTSGGVAWTNVSGRPTNLSSFTNDLGNYGSWITASGTLTGPVSSGSFCYTTQGLGVGTSYNQGAGYINATQNITAFYSDERLKENITVIKDALAKIKQISGVLYNSNDLAASFGYTDKSEQVGVLAGQIKKVLPQVVKPAPFDLANDKDGNTISKTGEHYMTVQYEKIVPLLIEGIKELTAKVEELESKLTEGK
jgi:hypothetical protein